ncbi:MAG: SH3 domain-containing protein [Sphingobacterium sp.]|jgi:hypothetical protein|uniref:SH3 domain-containing protein n=1 Tax=Sphingobacterium sp. TaxID=341027 RepID=UPI00284A7AD6|nr:SH3 domain-containing protein [Sphingobacterium sp.]MDR3011041.1 SH3 domain-containing protein [Sphingobacterium sp.]
MKYVLIVAILLFGFNFKIKAQYKAPFAIIQDKDGYVNVRQNPSIKSPIIGKIYNNQVFEDLSQFGSNSNNWIYISYGNNYDKKTQKFEEKSGYLYIDRILFLQKLPQLKRKIIDKNNVEFFDNEVHLKLNFGTFDVKSHRITKDNNDIVINIDNETPWGIDGILPENLTEIKSIKLIYKNKEFLFPRKSLLGLFQPNIDNMYVSMNNDTFFIVMSNSDAGGAYNIVWTVYKETIINRFINRDF